MVGIQFLRQLIRTRSFLLGYRCIIIIVVITIIAGLFQTRATVIGGGIGIGIGIVNIIGTIVS